MTMFRFTCMRLAAIAITVMAMASFASAQSSATIAGSVKDAQGGVIPGATITLISETRGTTFETLSNDCRRFRLFEHPRRHLHRQGRDGRFQDVRAQRCCGESRRPRGCPAHDVEVGALAETILVTGDAPMIQSQTGERSFTVTKEQVENLPMTRPKFRDVRHAGARRRRAGRTGARLDGARTNYMLDGISSVNTGGNQQGLELNADAIAEVKVVSSAYQAEYGRSTGIQISGVTKSGTNQFRGSVYDIERELGLELEQLGQRAERQPQAGGRSRGTGVIRSAARSASQAARTTCSSSTPNSFRRAPSAAPSIASACRPCSSDRATSRRPPTTPARSST